MATAKAISPPTEAAHDCQLPEVERSGRGAEQTEQLHLARANVAVIAAAGSGPDPSIVVTVEHA